jgi:CRP-like cAMP-binding protein
MNTLTQFLKHTGFDEPSIETISKVFTQKIFKNGDYFLKEGQTSKYLAFIEKGLFQHLVLTEDGTERTIYVAAENAFLASLLSFLRQVPSQEYVRCIAEATVWQVEKSNFQKLMEDVPGFKDFYIQMLEYQIGCIESSRFDFIMLSADQRYEKMLREEPERLQQIPLQYLASILGVTPRHLSRIRKKNA